MWNFEGFIWGILGNFGEFWGTFFWGTSENPGDFPKVPQNSPWTPPPTSDDVYPSQFCSLGSNESIHVEKSRGSSFVSRITARYRSIRLLHLVSFLRSILMFSQCRVSFHLLF